MDRLTFIEYSKLPIIVGERLFSIMDRDDSGLIKEDEFVTTMSQLFFGDFHIRVKLCFQM